MKAHSAHSAHSAAPAHIPRFAGRTRLSAGALIISQLDSELFTMEKKNEHETRNRMGDHH